MITWLRQINVTTRIMTLVCFLVAMMALVLLLMLFDLERIDHSSHQQKQKVSEQNHWLQQEAELMQKQEITQQLLQQAQRIQKTYSDMLFWYFDGSVTQYYDSLNNAASAANQLEQQLSELMTDPEAAKQAPVLLSNLAQYRTLMNNAIQYYTQGKSNLAGAEISDAHIVVRDMNEQLLQITQLFQTRLRQANAEVEKVLDQLLTSGVEIAEHSEQNQTRIEQIQQRTLIILLISIPVTAIIATGIIISIIRPLRALREQLLNIEHHNDLTLNLTLEGRDEIRTMSEAIQKLLMKFQTTLTGMDSMANQLKQTASHALSSSEATHQKSNEQQLKSSAIASSATELGASAEDILRTTRQALTRVQCAEQAAHSGQHDVQATAQCINQLATEFDEMALSVKDLAQHSDAIGTVLVVIQEIAEQTNLLALNAAIEAARAGDQGRGFAVVADEVRSLAQRTSQCTHEVHTLITRLQSQSSKAIQALEQNRLQMNAGVVLSQQAEASLSAIIQEMLRLVEINHSISAISEEQQLAVSTVDEGVQQVQQLAHAVEQHAAESESVSLQLEQMAAQLQQQLQKFKH